MPLFLAHLWRETENDPVLRQRALLGLRKYEQAKRRIYVENGVIHNRCGAARLLHIAAQKNEARAPVVLIPSLVNPHHILNLAERTSLARYLGAQGHDVWLVDWGSPGEAEYGLDLGGYIQHRLLPMLRSIGRPPILAGYCLGGTIALAAAQMLRSPAVVAIAAPWHFDRYPAEHSRLIADLWQSAKPTCERLGYVPMEVLQTGFWALDPARTIRKYAAYADTSPDSEAEHAFLAVEDWANEGAPLTYPVACEVFERLYAKNATGNRAWTVGGITIDERAVGCPGLSIRSATDRIVPADASPALTDNHESALGHVGMIVSAKAPQQIWSIVSQWLLENGG